MANTVRDRDEDVISGYVGGRRSALRIVDDWIDALRRDFRSLVKEWDDVRQEVRTRLFRNLQRGSFRRDSNLRTYVHQIARNVCVEQLRGRYRIARRPESPSGAEENSAPAPADAHADKELLRDLIRGLSPQDRELLWLVHVDRRSYAEVAALLGISEGAVKVRMFRCRRRVLERRRRLLRVPPRGGAGL
ncbi:MAG TPA: sigma-70 family RNA polymerase sigma factor [Candidatus Polarisedimenticolia bacterium]|nr:sigma-70 family RNA polymerase sigma factor [Candidatus Polarisedimenticolia bacterium]